MDDIMLIANSPEIPLAELASELLGIPLQNEVSTFTQDQDTEEDLQPSILSQLEQMEFGGDT